MKNVNKYFVNKSKREEQKKNQQYDDIDGKQLKFIIRALM